MCHEEIQRQILSELSTIRRMLESYEDKDRHIDQYYQISSNAPLILDYKNRRYLFAWSPSNLTCSATLGFITLNANAWTNISLGEASQLVPQTTSVTQVLVRATNEKLV